MCPFLDEEDDYQIKEPLNDADGFRTNFVKDDKKFFLIGGAASVVAFCVVAYIMYSSSKPVDLEELPVIHADNTPFKVKPKTNEQVKHQDKIVYDNISGDKRNLEEKIASQPEEVLSIPEIEGESLSDEEKKNIIQAFDDLASEKEYKINYVKKNAHKKDALSIVENQPPINRIEKNISTDSIKKQKQRIKNILEKTSKTNIENGSYGNIMVQVASVSTKSAAEAEYNRISFKNKFLKKYGKKIVKVDLGEKNGIKYRVQVGPFKNKIEADNAVATVKKSGISAYISR